MKPLSVTIRNFLSYGNNHTTINLDTRTVKAIIGRNLDSIVDGQIDSNGSGKSSIWEAIVYAGYDKSISGKSINQLINDRNLKNMEVWFDFEENNKFYRIDRYRNFKDKNPFKKGNGVFLLEKDDIDEPWNYKPKSNGGHDITNATGDIDKAIVKLLGYPYEIFTRIITIAAGVNKNYKPFMEMDLADQRNMVEEIFGYTELSEKAEILSENIKQNKKKYEGLLLLNDQIKLEIDRYNAQLNDLNLQSNNWNKNKKLKLSEILKDIKKYDEKYNNINFKAQELLFKDIKEISNQKTDIENKINLISYELKNIKKILKDIDLWEINHKNEKEILSKELEKYNNEFSIDFDIQEQILNDIDTLENESSNITYEINKIINEKSICSDTINAIKAWNSSHKLYIDKLQSDIDNANCIFKTADEYNAAKSEISKFEKNLEKISKEIDDEGKNLLTKRDKYLEINNNLVKIQKNLEHLNSNKCPYCNQNFYESQHKISECNNEILSIKDNLNKLNEEIDSLVSKISELEIKKLILVKEKNEFIKNLCGKEELNLDLEFKKTKLFEETNLKLSIKIKETNPYTKDNSLDDYNQNLDRLIREEENTKSNFGKIINDIKELKSKCLFKSLKELNLIKNKKNILLSKLESTNMEKNPYLTTNNINELEHRLVELSNLDKSHASNLMKLDEKINELKKLIIFESEKEITTTELYINNLLNNYNALKEEINPYKQSLENLQKNLPSKLKTEEIDKLSKRIENEEFLYKLLTRKDSFIRKALLNRYLPMLNERIHYYLSKLGLPHKVSFMPDMTVSISKFKTQKFYSGFSVGQKARVNIALSFSFRDVLQSRFGKIPFCLIDEALDYGLGNVGVLLCAKLIKIIAKENNASFFVISHKDEITSQFPESIVIDFKNGFSNIISQ